MAAGNYWTNYASTPSVFSPPVMYTTYDPCKLLPETPFRNKFMITMTLPFQQRSTFFFQMIN